MKPNKKNTIDRNILQKDVPLLNIERQLINKHIMHSLVENNIKANCLALSQ